MPIYEYVCSQCEKTTDVMQKVSDPAPGTCPSCNAEGTLSRMVSRTSFVLKGGGWYSDLYGSTKKSESSKSESSGSSASSSSSTTTAPSSPSSSTSSPSTPSSSGSSDGGTAKKAANA